VRGIVDVEILENLFEAVDIFDDWDKRIGQQKNKEVCTSDSCTIVLMKGLLLQSQAQLTSAFRTISQ
jgi:hypothetical protein